MLMQTVRGGWLSPFAVVCMLIGGCAPGWAPANEDSAKLSCSKYRDTFFSKPTTVQMAEFDSLTVENQYAVFICGNQVREPPSIHLATPFAKEGAAVVGFLKAKLTNADGDLTIRDILLVFAEMSRQRTYNVAGDGDLMRVITAAVGRVKDADWKKVCERSFGEIQKGAVAPTQ